MTCFLLRFAVIAGPFLALSALDIFVLGRSHHDIVTNDGMPYWFASSFPWVAARWSPLLHNALSFQSHLPAIPLAQAGAAYLAIAGLPVDSFDDFARFAMLLYGAAVVGAAALGAWMAGRLAVPKVLLAALALLAASQPGSHFPFTPYGFMPVFLVPVGIALVAFLNLEEDGGRTAIFGLFGLGWLTAMHYASLMPIVALCVALLVGLRDGVGADAVRRLGVRPVPLWWRLAALVCLAVLANGFMFAIVDPITVLTNFSQAATRKTLGHFRGRVALGAAAAAACGMIVVFLLARFGEDRPIVRAGYRVAGSILFGWAVGTNLLAFDAWQTRLWQTVTMGRLVEHADRARFSLLVGDPWGIVVVAVLGLSLVAIVASRRLPQGPGSLAPQFEFAGVFGVVVVGIDLLLAPTSEAGVAPLRYFFPVLACVPTLLCAIRRWSARGAALACAGFAVVSAMSIGVYVREVAPVARTAAAIHPRIESAIRAFLEKDPANVVACVNTLIFPERCQVAFTYAWVRRIQKSNRSAPPLPAAATTSRVQIAPGTDACRAPADCLGAAAVARPANLLLVVHLPVSEGLRPHLRPIADGGPWPLADGTTIGLYVLMPPIGHR